MTKPVLVLDCGTSALKAVVFSPDGEILDHAEADYPAPAVPHRQAPGNWWGAAIEAMRHLPPLDIAAISLSGTMENLIPVDAAGEPVTEAVMYSDPCGTHYLERLSKRLNDAGAAAVAGNAPEPLMSAFKLGWLRDAEPDAFGRARRFLPGSKDFLALQLTGNVATDAACAATTGLMDFSSRQWSPVLAAVHGIDVDRLPPILPADAAVGRLTEGAASALGLEPGIQVFNGCGDAAATTIGSGAEQAGDVSLYLGTSGWVARVSAGGDPSPRPYYRLPHPLHDGVIETLPILSAGAAAQWLRAVLKLDIADAEALAVAADAAPGQTLFLPYLSGERSPFVDLDLRAGFAGVSDSDGAGELYHAVLEGVALSIVANLEAMGGAAQRVSFVGGGAQSSVWAQIVADVLGKGVFVPAYPVAASSLGAFRLAAKALGLTYRAEDRGKRFAPRPDRLARAGRQARRFAAATQFLRELARIG